MNRLWMMVAITAVATGLAVAAPDTPPDTVKAVGTGRACAKADVMLVTFYVKDDAPTAVQAMAGVEKKVAAMSERLRAKFPGIKSIRVQDRRLGDAGGSTIYTNGRREEPMPRPEVTKRVQVVAPPNPTQAAEIVDTAIGWGAVLRGDDFGSIDALCYGLVNAAAAEAESRKAAFEDARRQAEALAQLAGRKLGAALSMEVETTPSVLVFRSARDETDVTTHLSTAPDSVVLDTSLVVTFRMEPLR